MEEVYPRLWVGGDEDYHKVAKRDNWSILRACKYGPSGHRDILGYNTLAAPEGKHRLWVRKGNVLALNILDLDDPNFIDDEMIDTGLTFIKDELAKGKDVLVACNQGKSRGPSIVLAFMQSVGEFPYSFVWSERIFRTLYPNYDPAQGIRHYVRGRWSQKDEHGS
jgi:hypothetical protein